MKQIYPARLKKALSLLKDSKQREVLVLSSNPQVVRSRDTHFPFRQNSDLYYFTGSYATNTTLVLRPESKDPIVLLVYPEDRVKTVWEGARPPIKPLAKLLKAEVITSTDHVKSLLG